MKRLLFLFFFISIFSFSQEEKRLALVIGNSNYDKGELKNPVSDANLIAQTLDSLDFDVAHCVTTTQSYTEGRGIEP